MEQSAILAITDTVVVAKPAVRVWQIPPVTAHLPVVPGVSRPSKHGHIYAIKMGDIPAIKIGFTEDVGKRLAGLATSSPLEYRVLASCPGSVRIEKAFHFSLTAYKIRGEWFREEGAVLGLMDLMRSDDDLWGQVETHLSRNKSQLWKDESFYLQREVSRFLRLKGLDTFAD